MDDLLSTLLNSLNETLTTAIVVLTVSMLLYNLSRNLRNRVARTSSAVLACIAVVYLCDALIALNPSAPILDVLVRLQWIGVALVPAATFHMSDALLATTGLPSRGRRRRGTRLLYIVGLLFVIAALAGDLVIKPVLRGNTLVQIVGGSLFVVYLAYFIIGTGVGFINLQRAKQRCLTRDTRRRMGYLQFAMLTAPFGVFPYSVLMGLSETGSVASLILVNLANIVIILMLLFLAYPLAFFGSFQPDRLVKADLLRFVLRGPATGLLALAVIIFITPATRILGLPGSTFMPFAVVGVVLLWQWTVALALPWLEKKLIYTNEDDDQLAKLQDLGERLLTRADLMQLLDAILASTCDFLQVNTAFVASLTEGKPELVTAVGPTRPSTEWLEGENGNILDVLGNPDQQGHLDLHKWHSYWISPLYSRRRIGGDGSRRLIGFIGVQARAQEIDLTEDDWKVFRTQIRRSADALDDIGLQAEIYAALEGLLPQINMTRTRAAEVEYRPGRQPVPSNETTIPDRELFIEQVKAALKHYWGGPGLTSSLLLNLNVVMNAMKDNGENPVRALRAVIQQAIERQRPTTGDRKLLSPEWTIYNILQERFIERHKVRDVAIRLALSEPDFYRKQRIAIEALADTLIDMEANAQTPQT